MGVLQLQTNKVAKSLRKGELVAFLTDTLYGKVADVFNPAAIQRIYEMKERLNYQPFPSPTANVEPS
jgi:tRNA A37 threonylcarbamoyladenosine synthetase subunit TsaC/SUA5/YrdC